MSGYDIKREAEQLTVVVIDAAVINSDERAGAATLALGRAFEAGVAAMKSRAADLINEMREDGESDLRSARDRILHARVSP